MEILILEGSPRKNGNTEILAEAFKKGAELGKGNNVEIVSVKDYKVNPCTGCNTCFKREGNKCFQKDDMQKIYDKLMKADCLVIASPLYFYGISAQLKAVVDRIHTPMREKFKIKKMALLMAGAASIPNLFDAVKVQYQMVLDYFKIENAGMVLADKVKDKGDILGNKALEDAYNLGKNLNL